ncbi:hypothetical protein LMG28727_05581 [Paraburkholderia kirstenboschensis]|nr:hypothetical protein LMG28727_05581 [Paraburkholderia kirstenboschensis]
MAGITCVCGPGSWERGGPAAAGHNERLSYIGRAPCSNPPIVNATRLSCAPLLAEDYRALRFNALHSICPIA